MATFYFTKKRFIVIALLLAVVAFSQVVLAAPAYQIISPLNDNYLSTDGQASLSVQVEATSTQVANVDLLMGLTNGDFENGDLSFYQSANLSNWSVGSALKHGGNFAARTTVNGAELSRIIDLSATNTLSFFYKNDPRSSFSLTDNGASLISPDIKDLFLSRQTGWLSKRVFLTPGQHNLKWTFSRPSGVSASGWLDDIRLSNVASFSRTLTAGTSTATTTTYSIDLTNLSEGVNSYRLVVTVDGDVATSAPRSIIVDQVPPSATINGLPSSYSTDRSFVFTVGGSDIFRYRYRLDGGNYEEPKLFSEKASLDGLSYGTHILEVIAEDSAGNWQSGPTAKVWTISTPHELPTPAPIETPKKVEVEIPRGSSRPASDAPVPQELGSSRVLGVSTFNFIKDLETGMSGQEVILLQRLLKDEGFLSGPVTGYYGSVTAQTIKALQKKYKIKPVNGRVGPLTRKILNQLNAQ